MPGGSLPDDPRGWLEDTWVTLGGRAARKLGSVRSRPGDSKDIGRSTTRPSRCDAFVMTRQAAPASRPRTTQPFLGREFSTEPDYADEISTRGSTTSQAHSSKPPTGARGSSPTNRAICKRLSRSVARDDRKRSPGADGRHKERVEVEATRSRPSRAAGDARRSPSARSAKRSPARSRARPRRTAPPRCGARYPRAPRPAFDRLMDARPRRTEQG